MQIDKFDIVVLGTGLQQCILAENLASKGLKVLQIDQNKSYGSDLRTMNYSDLAAKCKQEINNNLLSKNRSFNIDITPKFLLADGLMKDLIVEHDLQNLISFIDITGHFVYKKNNLHLIPYNEKDSLMSSLISLMQKPKVAQFFWSVRKYSQKKEESELSNHRCPKNNPKQKKQSIHMSKDDLTQNHQSETHRNKQNPENSSNLDFKKANIGKPDCLDRDFYQFHSDDMFSEFKYYSLNKDSIDLIGHAIALNLDDSYLKKHPSYTYNKIYYYIKSLVSLNGIKTPFIYPLYGISELCQAFSRRAGIAGCTFMLNTPVLYIKNYTNSRIYSQDQELEDFQPQNKHKTNLSKNLESNLQNLTIGGENYKFEILIQDNINKTQRIIKTKKIISELSYFKNHSIKTHEIITGVFIIEGRVPLIHKKYKDTPSAHVLFLANELKRENDIFMAVLGEREQATPENYFVCILTTKRESQMDPINELEPCLGSLGKIVGQFVWCRDFCISTLEEKDIVFVRDVDETTHLESIFEDYLRCKDQCVQ